MGTNRLASRPAIIAILVLQFIPILLLPPRSFSLNTQEWWLPALLSILSIIATIQLMVQKSETSWPWDLISFSHGFNIISRLMLIMPHSMTIVNGVDTFNTLYVSFSIFSMLASGFMLMYIALPQVRSGLLQD